MPLAPTHTVNYKTEDFAERIHQATDGRGVDVLVDFVGKAHWDRNIASLAVDGRMVLLALLSGMLCVLVLTTETMTLTSSSLCQAPR